MGVAHNVVLVVASPGRACCKETDRLELELQGSKEILRNHAFHIHILENQEANSLVNHDSLQCP